VLLRLTSPGVPDLYQGCELWDYSLVDPDNRRPIDYRRCREVLAGLEERIARAGDEPERGLAALANELVDGAEDGKVKAYVIYQGLNFRRAHAALFGRGDYLPLEATGPHRDHVCAFARCTADEVVLVVVPRLVVGLVGGVEQPPLGLEVWGKTALILPPHLAGRDYHSVFTGEVLLPAYARSPDTKNTPWGAPGLLLGNLLERFPVALLHSC
jgi:(1->4)-alpha-D-glucan 1-alpha-D-glucosylmutase